MLLEASDLKRAIDNKPFQTNNGKDLHFYFLQSAPERLDLADLEQIRLASEHFALHGSILYFYAPEGIGRSKLAAKIERSLGVPVTARNWNTIAKLDTMVQTTL